MRIAWYASASTALAASVVVSAFHQRANFYSAMVYLSQSSFCLIVLVNFILMAYTAFMYSLQRLCFGTLRQIETEQLYERTWYAITETLLAMTMFRDEIGAWFLVMFTALVTGRVWGWIGDGRVEVLEQQPPQNPRLFHSRLSVSLLLSIFYDIWILRYVINTVIDQAKPTMMVMFLFEFAVLSIQSIRTAARYGISVYDHWVTAKQTRDGLERKRREIRHTRADIWRRREDGGPESEAHNEELPEEDDVDEIDIEVPGWENKGLFILSLELIIDALKCLIYIAFFSILLVFFTMPLHIMRDLFFTFRSLIKRVNALMKYRRAVRDMDRYPDATQEELTRENTCIICREEMRPWTATPDSVERNRPKKLPCGHILHFGCLKSWLERQQVCPTCRRSVTERNNQDQAPGGGNGVARGDQGQQQAGNPDGARGDEPQQRERGGVRIFNLGPIRLGFVRGNPNQLQELAERFNAGDDNLHPDEHGHNNDQQPQQHHEHHNQPQQGDGHDQGGRGADIHLLGRGSGGQNNISLAAAGAQLFEVEQHLFREMQGAINRHQETHVAQLLWSELMRLRQVGEHQQQNMGMRVAQGGGGVPAVSPVVGAGAGAGAGAGGTPSPQPQRAHPANQQAPIGLPPLPQYPPQHLQHHWPPSANFPPRVMTPTVTRHVGPPYGSAIPSGSADLPEGVVIPPGWQLLPLQRMDAASQPNMTAAASLQTSQQISQLMNQHLNNLVNPQVPPSDGVGGSNSPTTAIPDSQATINNASGPTGEPSSSTQDQAGPSMAPSVSETRNVQASGDVASPTPVVPNWGSRSQLFGGQAAAESEETNRPLFGDGEEASGSGPGTGPGTGSSSGPEAGPTSDASSDDEPFENESSGGSDNSSEASSTGGRATRHVTVEDATDSEDE
ncbi:hypothetical protein MKZ38_001967 [Zalerion maritima]|uniref:RING-type E3 ubiquitin transferase n=1 Tax=Zalerion maritima TaxID=339359 RepID=A0AAD5RPL3_9PEZI|nr:hypothetical protein MKZ38_001967 [Zalerion maritima]